MAKDNIKRVQKFLNTKGNSLDVDGYLGDKSEYAIYALAEPIEIIDIEDIPDIGILTPYDFMDYYELNGIEYALSLLVPFIQSMMKYGVRPSLMLGQFLRESFKGNDKIGENRWSGLFKYRCNLHGIKGDTGELLLTREENEFGVWEDVLSKFAIFESIKDGILGYCKLMCGSSYNKVISAETWQNAVYELGQSSYATDSSYASGVGYWIELYNLWQYDTYEFTDRANQVFKTTKKGIDDPLRVKKVQQLLNRCGYNLEIDGDYGRLTENAVKDFQEKHGLDDNGKYDGVCGINTYLVLVEQADK